MRFETKSLQEKRLTLRRLHRFLNDMVFNNELDEDIIIDIQDINEYKDEDDIYNDAICGIYVVVAYTLQVPYLNRLYIFCCLSDFYVSILCPWDRLIPT